MFEKAFMSGDLCMCLINGEYCKYKKKKDIRVGLLLKEKISA